MQFAISIKTPEVPGEAPLALLNGTFAERLRKAADYGYQGVELVVSDPRRLDPVSLRAQLGAYGLKPAAVATGFITGSSGLSLVSRDAENRREAAALLRELVELAGGLDCQVVTIGGFRGKAANAGGFEPAKEQLLEALSQADPLASRLGVRLGLEPLRSAESDFLNNARQVCDLIEEGGNKSVGLLLDVYHMVEEPDLLDAFRRYRRQLVHVHLADTDRKGLGQGTLDFLSVERTLGEIQYTGWQSLELPRSDDPDGNGFLPEVLREL